MIEQKELVRRVVSEIREARPPHPAKDIDIVWVLSAPGTIKEPSGDGIYNGEIANWVSIQAGISLVRKITALRLDKKPEEVTKKEIEVFGPALYYNGEDRNTQNVKYLQNEALKEAIKDSNFPLPESKVVIDHIDTIGTPAQVQGMARFLRSTGFEGKVAVVSMIHHSRRLARYLRHYGDLMPDNVQFVNAYIPETVNSLGKTLREVRKIVKYTQKGDLAEEPLEGF
ncbi:MAG TPA: hypothetical protein VJ227_03130 [Patescibacteria group bacterium]|nr:hypothetical protein [Patescibacteria group bacterium]